MKIARALLDQLVEHVQEDPRNEICGIVEVDSLTLPAERRRAVQVHRAANLHASPLRFEVEPEELLHLSSEIEDRGNSIGAIYHSHVRSQPVPSQTDINYASGWPGVEWIIVGLADADAPEVRSYLIENGRVRELPLEVS